MIYLPEDKWSSRYNADFFTVRMNKWHYVRNEEELTKLHATLADDIAATAAATAAAASTDGSDATSSGCKSAAVVDSHVREAVHTQKHETTTAAESSTTSTDATVTHHVLVAENEYDSNDDNSENSNNFINNALHPNMTKSTTTTTTCTFFGISRSSSLTTNSCFFCHPGANIAANNGKSTRFLTEKTNRQPQKEKKKTESFPAVYYEIQVCIGRGGNNSIIGRKNTVVVFRRYSHFRALCQEMDDDEKRNESGAFSGSVDRRRKNKSISDLLTKCLHPKEPTNWFLSHIQLWKLAWFDSSSSTTSSNEYYHDRMIGLHLFLHTLLCRQECANNSLIEKFLGLEDE